MPWFRQKGKNIWVAVCEFHILAAILENGGYDPVPMSIQLGGALKMLE